MTAMPSTEQLSISAAASELLARELSSWPDSPEASADPPQITDRLWTMCAELGWLALATPSTLGGLGLGAVEEVMLFRELGRFAAPGPFRSSVLGAHVAALAGDEELVAALISGDRRAGIALGELTMDARSQDLVLSIGADSACLRELTAIEPATGVDPGITWGTAELGKVVAEADRDAVLVHARIIVSAELLGVVEAVRDMSAAYARTRIQFGKPIGTFQAVKHRCADMAIGGHATLSQLLYAASAVDGGSTQAPFQAAAAYVLAVESARKSTADNIQNHGGIGFTWEHKAHIYLKRALVLEDILGPARTVYEDILRHGPHEFA